MKNIAIFGGTFNPIHNGHIIAIQSLMDSSIYDEIWLMPNRIQPFKGESPENLVHRLNMCKLLCLAIPELKLCTVEIDSPTISYTLNTLDTLYATYSETLFHWIIGYDNLTSIKSWYKSEELLTKHSFSVVNRGGFNKMDSMTILEELNKQYGTKFTCHTIPNIELSSTLLRERIANRKSLLGFTLESIIEYIVDTNIYQKTDL